MQVTDGVAIKKTYQSSQEKGEVKAGQRAADVRHSVFFTSGDRSDLPIDIPAQLPVPPPPPFTSSAGSLALIRRGILGRGGPHPAVFFFLLPGYFSQQGRRKRCDSLLLPFGVISLINSQLRLLDVPIRP